MTSSAGNVIGAEKDEMRNAASGPVLKLSVGELVGSLGGDARSDDLIIALDKKVGDV